MLVEMEELEKEGKLQLTFVDPPILNAAKYEYLCPACNGKDVQKIGNTQIVHRQHKVLCRVCGAVSSNNSFIPEHNEELTNSDARKLLKQLRAIVEERSAELDKAFADADGDKEKIMKQVMPSVIDCLLTVFADYGYTKDHFGIKNGIRALQQYSGDEEVASAMLELRAIFCPTAAWADRKRFEDHQAVLAEEARKQRLEEEKVARIKAAREKKERMKMQQKALELEEELGDYNPQDGLYFHPKKQVRVWPGTLVAIKTVADQPTDFDWHYNSPQQGPVWREAKVQKVQFDGSFDITLTPDANEQQQQREAAAALAAAEAGMAGSGDAEAVEAAEKVQAALAEALERKGVKHHLVRLDGRDREDARLPSQTWQAWPGQWVW